MAKKSKNKDPNVRRLIKEIADDTRRIVFTNHALKRMVERNITDKQVFQCLKHGAVVEPPAPDVHGNWVTKLGCFSGGDEVKVVVALKEGDDGHYVIVVTVMGE